MKIYKRVMFKDLKSGDIVKQYGELFYLHTSGYFVNMNKSSKLNILFPPADSTEIHLKHINI